MDNFLMIVPDSYIEIDAQMFFEQTGHYPEDLLIVFLSGAVWELTNIFVEFGYTTDVNEVLDFKVFDSNGDKKIWVKFTQIGVN